MKPILSIRQSGMRVLCLLFAVLMILSSGGTAFASEMSRVIASASEASEVALAGMVPIYGKDIDDGTYLLSVRSSSRYFRVKEAELTVEDGEMTALLRMDSYAYSHIFLGTGEEATVSEDGRMEAERDAEGYTVFRIPVEALNAPFACAAYSKKNKGWYDRTLLIDAAGLPAESLSFALPDYEAIDAAVKAQEKADAGTEETEEIAVQGGAAGSNAYDPITPAETGLSDGEYSIEVNMTGGSGRASVSSPTYLIVKDGKAYARLIWSSTYYDYMIVGGERFENEAEDGGNSRFTVPIADFDRILPVIADTTAMGDPVAIEYSLTFYRETIGERGLIPQEAAKKVLIIGAAVIVVGGILNYLLKKRKGR